MDNIVKTIFLVSSWILTFSTSFIILKGIHNYLHTPYKRKICSSKVRILFLPALYSLEASLSISFPSWSPLFIMFRGLCEALVIIAFLQYLVIMLDDVHLPKKTKHLIPCSCCFSEWEMKKIIISILQYVLVMFIVMPITLLSWAGNRYLHPSKFSPKAAYIYCTIIRNISQMLAIYGLIMLYKILYSEIQKKIYKPILKLACIKLIVFFTFWQSILISGLVYKHYVDSENDVYYNSGILSMEMLLFAFLHLYAFSGQESEYNIQESQISFYEIVCDFVNPSKILNECKCYYQMAHVPNKRENLITQSEDYDEL